MRAEIKSAIIMGGIITGIIVGVIWYFSTLDNSTELTRGLGNLPYKKAPDLVGIAGYKIGRAHV